MVLTIPMFRVGTAGRPGSVLARGCCRLWIFGTTKWCPCATRWRRGGDDEVSCTSRAALRARRQALRRAGAGRSLARDLADYPLAHSARADPCRRLGKTGAARASYERALGLTRQEPQRRFLERRLAELED
jgi:hypothetical protein